MFMLNVFVPSRLVLSRGCSFLMRTSTSPLMCSPERTNHKGKQNHCISFRQRLSSKRHANHLQQLAGEVRQCWLCSCGLHRQSKIIPMLGPKPASSRMEPLLFSCSPMKQGAGLFEYPRISHHGCRPKPKPTFRAQHVKHGNFVKLLSSLTQGSLHKVNGLWCLNSGELSLRKASVPSHRANSISSCAFCMAVRTTFQATSACTKTDRPLPPGESAIRPQSAARHHCDELHATQTPEIASIRSSSGDEAHKNQ